jgi:hypothetical protein
MGSGAAVMRSFVPEWDSVPAESFSIEPVGCDEPPMPKSLCLRSLCR